MFKVILSVIIVSCVAVATEASENEHVVEKLQNNRNFIKSYLKFAPPFDLSQVDHVSADCKKHTVEYLEAMERVELWALKMHDSSAKLPSGILNGNINQFGDFDQCLGIVAPNKTFQGKYCLAYLQPKVDDDELLEELRRNIQAFDMIRSDFEDPGHIATRFSTILWALCVPSSCTARDVELGLKHFMDLLSLNSSLNLRIKVNDEMCYEKDNQWLSNIPLGTKIASLLFLALVVIVALSTYLDNDEMRTKTGGSHLSDSWLTAFSLKQNIAQLTSISENSGDIKTAHGIRFFNVILLLLAHRGEILIFNPYTNRTEMSHETATPLSVFTRSSVLFTDTFLMLSGMLTVYSFLGRLKKGASINFRKDFVGRYVRIMPPVIAMIIFTTHVFPHLGSGPQWNTIVKPQSDLCSTNWWQNLLLIQNFFGFENICVTHTHYVATDTQLFLTTPVIAYLLWKIPGKGVLYVIGLIFLSHIGRFLVTYLNEISDFLFFGNSVTKLYETADLMYILPMYRFGSYGIGILLAYTLRNFRHIKLNNMQLAIGWCTSFLLLFASFFGAAPMASVNYKFNPMHAALFAALAPIGWCLGLSWIVFVSEIGCKNIGIKILEWRGFQISTKLSYAIYLTQYTIFYFNIGSKRAAEHFGLFKTTVNLHEFIWILVASIILTIFVELPFGNIKKLLLDSKPPSKVEKEKLTMLNNNDFNFNNQNFNKKEN